MIHIESEREDEQTQENNRKEKKKTQGRKIVE
jgi:hypothetical protein